ncbi:TPA: methylation-associated defense system AAA family ATPase MAD3 [Photobacterium damselae]
MITRIEAYRYRCFNKLDLELDNLHVFAGSNGSGKTTLLDIPALIGDILMVSDINDAFFKPMNGRERARADSPRELVHRLKGDNFTLVLEAEIPEEQQILLEQVGPSRFRTKPENRSNTVRYELSIGIVEDKLEVKEEHLMLFNYNDRVAHGSEIQGGRFDNKNVFQVIERSNRQKAIFSPEWADKRQNKDIEFALQNERTAFASMPADSIDFPAAFWFLEFLKNGSHCYEPQWSAMRLAASPRDKHAFKADGSSLPWQVHALQQSDPEGLNEWLELVQMALPSIAKIEAKQRIDDSFCYIEVTYTNSMTVPSSGLSHGTLHILALTIIPYMKNAPKIITLEEPENGIHPKAIDTVMDALSSVGMTQLFLSTHSPSVLAHTSIESIISLRFDVDGATQVLKGTEHPALKEWKGELDLGTLFAAGIFE